MERLRGLDLFSGIGGLALGLAEWVRVITYCERDDYAQAVLLSRMQAGDLDQAPIWDDVRTLRVRPGEYDIVYGGFPCQDLSDASRGRGHGITGSRSGLWSDMCRIVEEAEPSIVFIENVDGAALKKWLPVVRKDLNRLGYSSVSLRVRAFDLGAPFEGGRVFVAATNGKGKSAIAFDEQMAIVPQSPNTSRSSWRKPPSKALGVADGTPFRMERLKCLGNGVVPVQAREAFRLLMTLC